MFDVQFNQHWSPDLICVESGPGFSVMLIDSLPRSLPTILCILDLQDTLPQILALQHSQEPINRIVHTLRDMINTLETAVLDPFGDVLVAVLAVFGDIRVVDEETSPGETLPDHSRVVGDPVRFAVRRIVVLGYRTAGNWMERQMRNRKSE